MNRFYYDLHLHSCLSPCGDNDMTPNNIVGMGVLNRLDIMALTDHNTCKNCPAFYDAAKRNGIIPIAGMELTTSEDIHVVCLFPELESAMEFDSLVENSREKLPNKPSIFGDQIIMDEFDEIIGNVDYVLSFATHLSIEDTFETVRKYGGVAYPAHIDRESNGVIAVLGSFPNDCGFTAAEFRSRDSVIPYSERYPSLRELTHVISSDAHYLWDINEKREFFDLDDEPYSAVKVVKSLFDLLLGGKSEGIIS